MRGNTDSLSLDYETWALTYVRATLDPSSLPLPLPKSILRFMGIRSDTPEFARLKESMLCCFDLAVEHAEFIRSQRESAMPENLLDLVRLHRFKDLYSKVVEELQWAIDRAQIQPVPRTLASNPILASEEARKIYLEAIDGGDTKQLSRLLSKACRFKRLKYRGGFEPNSDSDDKIVEWAVAFLILISDPRRAERLFVCNYCRHYSLATYQRRQRFCSKSCNTKWHYEQDPERKKEQVRIHRKLVKEEEERIRLKILKKTGSI